MTSPVKWWVERREELEALLRDRYPAYVYDEETLNDTLFDLLSTDGVKGVFYDLRTNPHQGILEKAYKLGAGFKCVSFSEFKSLVAAFPGTAPHQILFAPNCAGPDEYAKAFEQELLVLIDTFLPLKAWPHVFRNREILVSIAASEMDAYDQRGIPLSQMKTLQNLADMLEIGVKGLRFQLDNRVFFDPGTSDKRDFIPSHLLTDLPSISLLILSEEGIFPRFARSGDHTMSTLEETIGSFAEAYPQLGLWLEAGGGVVSTAIVLLTRVTEVFQEQGNKCIRIEWGIDCLIHSALSGMRPILTNFSRPGEKAITDVHLVGPNSGLRYVSRLGPVEEGDVLLVAGPLEISKASGRQIPVLCLRARKMCPVPI